MRGVALSKREVRSAERVPFVPEQKEPKVSSGALPLKTPFYMDKSVRCSPYAAFHFVRRRALIVGSAVLRTEESFYGAACRAGAAGKDYKPILS